MVHVYVLFGAGDLFNTLCPPPTLSSSPRSRTLASPFGHNAYFGQLVTRIYKSAQETQQAVEKLINYAQAVAAGNHTAELAVAQVFPGYAPAYPAQFPVAPHVRAVHPAQSPAPAPLPPDPPPPYSADPPDAEADCSRKRQVERAQRPAPSGKRHRAQTPQTLLREEVRALAQLSIEADDTLPAYSYGTLTKRDQFAYLQFLGLERISEAHKVPPELLRAARIARAARDKANAEANAAASSSAQTDEEQPESSVLKSIFAP